MTEKKTADASNKGFEFYPCMPPEYLPIGEEDWEAFVSAFSVCKEILLEETMIASEDIVNGKVERANILILAQDITSRLMKSKEWEAVVNAFFAIDFDPITEATKPEEVFVFPVNHSGTYDDYDKLLLQMLGAAVEDREKQIQARETAEKKNALNVISLPSVRSASSLEYPLDKVNNTVWGLLGSDTGGQIALKAEKSGSKKQINIYYSVDFESLGEGVTISKQLNAFDKRAYIAVSALFNAGNEIVTIPQIYHAMGCEGSPNQSNIKKINDSLTKMASARIYVNNTQEVESGYNYPKFVYDGPLLPMERMQAIVKGGTTNAAIHLFREPPVVSFAKERKQITTIKLSLLQSPVSKTDSNLRIEDYLITRIFKGKRKGGSVKILLSTLYSRAEINTAKQKQRAPEKIKTFLEHYKANDEISRYTITADSVTVYF